MQPVELQQCDLIAFDNDGTLYPAGADVCRSILEAHSHFVKDLGINVETPTIEYIQAKIGADAAEFYASLLPGQSRKVIDEFESYCHHHEKNAINRMPHLYNGAQELLFKLKESGRTLILVSNGSPRYLRHIWEAAGYENYFSAMYPYGPPDFLTKGERLKIGIEEWERKNSVMIGDRRSDYDAARHADVPFVGCAYGYGAAEELSDAKFVIRNLNELADLLL